jgi:hypothetical protein
MILVRPTHGSTAACRSTPVAGAASQSRPGQELTDEQIEFFDQLAALTANPDESFVELRDRYQTDERLRVPTTVLNTILGRTESVHGRSTVCELAAGAFRGTRQAVDVR